MRYKSGDRVGSMTLVCLVAKVSYGSNVWRVLCDCGRTSDKKVSDFYKLLSCSYTCPLHETKKRVYPKDTRKEQLAWHDIKKRCLDPTHPSFDSYGGRGITVCTEWRDSFDAFYAHIGRAPAISTSVDRIDNNKGYEPGNVRWATKKQQSNNKRKSVHITANGLTKTLAEWAEALNAPYDKLYWRYSHGWSHDDIVNK